MHSKEVLMLLWDGHWIYSLGAIFWQSVTFGDFHIFAKFGKTDICLGNLHKISHTWRQVCNHQKSFVDHWPHQGAAKLSFQKTKSLLVPFGKFKLEATYQKNVVFRSCRFWTSLAWHTCKCARTFFSGILGKCSTWIPGSSRKKQN